MTIIGYAAGVAVAYVCVLILICAWIQAKKGW